MIKKNITSDSLSKTHKIAAQIGSKLQGGEFIELISDIGGGKTAFVQGLAKGAGSKDRVASPTFTISKIYDTPNFKIAHFDFYRLSNDAQMKYEVEELINRNDIVVVVEWSKLIKDILPQKRLIIKIDTPKMNQRVFEFEIPNELKYLLEANS